MTTDEQAPATCPTCGSPVTIPAGGRQHWSGVPQSLMTQAIPPDYRPATDPARTRAMTEILSELRDNRDYPAGERYVTLNARVWDDWQARIATLLPPKEAP